MINEKLDYFIEKTDDRLDRIEALLLEIHLSTVGMDDLKTEVDSLVSFKNKALGIALFSGAVFTCGIELVKAIF